MAQLPKGGLVRGHDKPIHGSCAMYFPGGIHMFFKVNLILRFVGWQIQKKDPWIATTTPWCRPMAHWDALHNIGSWPLTRGAQGVLLLYLLVITAIEQLLLRQIRTHHSGQPLLSTLLTLLECFGSQKQKLSCRFHGDWARTEACQALEEKLRVAGHEGIECLTAERWQYFFKCSLNTHPWCWAEA